MLEKPPIADAQILTCLQQNYGIVGASITFLPLGADPNSSAYRVIAPDGADYFVKLRSSVFDPVAVALPKFLSDRGIRHIIAPVPSNFGQLAVPLYVFTVIVYQFVEGQNGYESELTDAQWNEFGSVLNRIHTTVLPPALHAQLPVETYSPQARDRVMQYLEWVDGSLPDDPLVRELAAFLQSERTRIVSLVERTAHYAQALRSQLLEYTVCHTDLHAGNFLITPRGEIYIVDWDAPMLAPREHDLMFVGGMQFGNARTPVQEAELFYRGYGHAPVNPLALAYYRYDRIIQDIAVECDEIWYQTVGPEDRTRELHFLKSNFQPGETIEFAYRVDTTLAEFA